MEELKTLLVGVNGDMSILFKNGVLIGALFIFLAIATYTDLKDMKIYHKFNWAFLISRIIFAVVPYTFAHRFGLTHLAGGLIGFFFLLAPAIALMHKMGGDIRFMGIMGTFLGGYLTVVFLLIACIYNLIFSMFFIFILKKGKVNTKLPFAPFFLLAFITLFLWNMITH